ncbi:MAG: MlaD family protein, partial [Verrucomicrobiae bacterium]|nr:MlaD family protein [Verrucomicrobiae bacterium]
MKEQRLLLRVGVFVLIGLVLASALIILFSKGLTLGKPTYEILLRTGNVGGIKRGAAVLMAGVPVGSVGRVDLTPDGKAVIIHLKILKQYLIRSDASFVIEQAGFLGDQYVSIVPTKNEGSFLKDGDIVVGIEPFNLQEAARAATGFLKRADETIQQLNGVVERLDRILLTEVNLTNVSAALANFREVSARVNETAIKVDALIESNKPSITTGMSNLVAFSETLQKLAADLREAVATNRDQASTAISNLNAASMTVNRLLNDMESGRGLAGTILRDDLLAAQWKLTISNLSVLSSNLNRFGLLYKPPA